MPSERLKRDMLLLCCLSYLYNINRMINSAHTSRPVRSDTLFINLNGLCIFQTCDLKTDNLILKNELRQRLCNSEQLQCLQRFDYNNNRVIDEFIQVSVYLSLITLENYTYVFCNII